MNDIAGLDYATRPSRDETTRKSQSTPQRCTVAIIGAGPYGLAVGAHLREAGVAVRLFGDLMSFWRDHMPKGMLLRSEWAGSHIGDRKGPRTLDRYERARGKPLSRRIPLADFVAYARWYQQQGVPALDPRHVAAIAMRPGGFRLTLVDGDTIEAERVVVATGLTGYALKPPAFEDIPQMLAPHSSDINDPAAFSGLSVVVVGAGQSALETAALLNENGAHVEVIARSPAVHWLTGREGLRRRSGPLRALIYPPGEVGPPGINWIVQFPDVFRAFPVTLQRRMARRAIRPAGSGWLRPRLAGVPITAGRAVTRAEADGGRLRLTLNDGSRRQVDRAVLATGFRVDLERSGLFDPQLLEAIERVDGAPLLGRGMESSVPGLHFVGAAAAESFGPLMRFVAGSGYAARAVTRRIAATL